MKKVIKFISLIFIFLLLILFLLIDMDRQTNYYSNKHEVLRDNAIQRGWIPNILPNSAYEIVETHNIDTNKLSGTFKYLEKDEQNFLNSLKKQENKLVWEDFEFIVDTKNNKVKFFDFSSKTLEPY